MQRRFAKCSRVFPVIAFLSLSACVGNIGRTVDVPQIPPVPVEVKENIGGVVSVEEFADARPLPGGGDAGTSEPAGQIHAAVAESIRKALTDRGVYIAEDAPVRLKGEVREWTAKVETKVNTTLSSTAKLYVELIDKNGSPIYTGSYTGTRSSQFPFVSTADVQDSLGLAMSNAVQQVVADIKLGNALQTVR